VKRKTGYEFFLDIESIGSVAKSEGLDLGLELSLKPRERWGASEKSR
jgi:hypothetical protein